MSGGSRRSRVQAERVVVITLERTPDRLRRFVGNNPSLTIETFAAVDGRTLDRPGCIADGLIVPGNLYSPGALGSAASHVALWRRCVQAGAAMHVAEDDALIRHDFAEAADRALSQLASWDYVLWGWNFDWPLKVRLAPGLGTTTIQSDQDELRREWRAFQDITVQPRLTPLLSCTGTCCYSLSPRGASRLLERVLPIGDQPAPYPLRPGVAVANTSVDIELSRHFAELDAYVALPCLAISLNSHNESTIYHN